MRHLIQRLIATVAVLVMGFGSSIAFAQDMDTRVIVPDAPNGALVSGCYRTVGLISKVYRLEFCLERRGQYWVEGGGHYCTGGLDWSARAGTVRVSLKRTSCGGGVAWSADSMTCRPNGGFLSGILPKVIVPNLPNLPSLGGLRCDYRPAAGSGEKPTSFIARRARI